jgi:hypothetical protein
MASPKMKRDWSKVKHRIRNTWNEVEFSDQELKEGRKILPEMVKLVREKTGEPRKLVRDKIMVIIECPDLAGVSPASRIALARY